MRIVMPDCVNVMEDSETATMTLTLMDVKPILRPVIRIADRAAMIVEEDRHALLDRVIAVPDSRIAIFKHQDARPTSTQMKITADHAATTAE